MNKATKISIFSCIIATVVIAVGALVYFKFYTLSSYSFSTPKGQQYKVKYFKGAKSFRSDKAVSSPNLLLGYPEEGMAVAMNITDALNKPFTKNCTGTKRFAFAVGDYEVCKLIGDESVKSLIAKIGNDGKYFAVTFTILPKDQPLAASADVAPSEDDYNLMDYQNQFVTILKSVHPIN